MSIVTNMVPQEILNTVVLVARQVGLRVIGHVVSLFKTYSIGVVTLKGQWQEYFLRGFFELVREKKFI